MTCVQMLQMCCIHSANVGFGPKADKRTRGWVVREVPEADIYDHIKPGLRGRYCVQSPKPGDSISSIGKVMRMPCLTARLSALSHVPGRNADICSEPPSAAIFNAV